MSNPFVYVGLDNSTEIRIFELDLRAGALIERGGATAGPCAHYLAFHPSGRFLYAVSEAKAGRVFAFSVQGATGALSPLNDVSTGGEVPAHISMHGSGRFLLAANYGSGEAVSLPILDDGRLGDAASLCPAGAEAHMILDDGQSGGFVFVPSKGDHRILQFKFDDRRGTLEPNSPPFVAQAGSPRHMAFHPSGTFAYLLTEAGRSLVSYHYDASRGLLTDGSTLLAAPSGTGAHVLVHPSGEFAYASIREHDSIALFTLDASGRPHGPVHMREGIDVPWDFAIDPSGQFMVVGNHGNDTVTVFHIDRRSGTLTSAGPGASGLKPRCVAMAPPTPRS